mmetsp:Transcript_6182/g.9322  ORF Transcript_6182/g.9322 Transcript_6182/m.9322 type:complete len:220 (+) Transcript_6182:18-677(+)
MNVTVNVYDLPGQTTTNNNLYPLGLGFYHSGVQINEYEYSFSETGVCRTRPLLPAYGTLRAQLSMGQFNGSAADILIIINRLRNNTFKPEAYDILRCNCNHFSEAFCIELLGVSLPDWLNRAASLGNTVTPVNTLQGTKAKTSPIIPAPGQVKSPSLSPTPAAPASSTSTVFSWLFGSSSGPKPLRSSSSEDSNRTKKKELTEEQKKKLAAMKKANATS